MKQAPLVLILTLVSAPFVHADENAAKRAATLQARIAAVESRLATLEGSPSAQAFAARSQERVRRYLTAARMAAGHGAAGPALSMIERAERLMPELEPPGGKASESPK
jgi:hypothetical protein